MSIVVHCLQHSERVQPQSVADWAADRGVELRIVRADLEPLPAVAEVDRLVVLGGGMNTDDTAEHPWLTAEEQFLRRLLDLERARVLGICLGSQLLARVLGGAIRRSPTPEIGWQRILLTDAGRRSHAFGTLPKSFEAMQWHGDEWSLPPGAQLAATSDGCPFQAFTAGDLVTAVQFHPEFTHQRTVELAATTTDDLTGGGWVQTPEQFLADPTRFARMRQLCDALLDQTLLAPLPMRAARAVAP